MDYLQENYNQNVIINKIYSVEPYISLVSLSLRGEKHPYSKSEEYIINDGVFSKAF